jgi:hypothetical protein
MGIFDSDESEEEVQISPNEETSTQESKLKSEVESKVVPGGSKKDGDESSTVSSVGSGSQVSRKSSSKDVGIEDVYRQNERIIELLEEISDGKDNNENSSESKKKDEFDGDLNGVL